MVEIKIGHCKHGEFNLFEGCPQCIAGKYSQSTGNAPPTVGSTTAPLITTEVVIPIEIPTTLVLVKPEASPEIMSFYNQAVRLREFAEARIILTNDDLKPANDDLVIIRRIKKAMEEKRKDYLKPFQDHVKETNDAYKKLMEPIEEADKITAGKMLAFDVEQKRKIREAEAIEAEKYELAKREAELKGGEITIDLTPVDKPEDVPRMVRGLMGNSGQRENWTYEIIDVDAIPREYMMPDNSMLSSTARTYHDKKPVAGVRFYNKPSIVTRR